MKKQLSKPGHSHHKSLSFQKSDLTSGIFKNELSFHPHLKKSFKKNKETTHR